MHKYLAIYFLALFFSFPAQSNSSFSVMTLNVNNLFDEEYLSQSQTNFHNDGGRTWNGINVENNVYFGKGTTWNLGLNINF